LCFDSSTSSLSLIITTAGGIYGEICDRLKLGSGGGATCGARQQVPGEPEAVAQQAVQQPPVEGDMNG